MHLNGVLRQEARETARAVVDGELGVVLTVGARLAAVILAVQHCKDW